MTNTEIANMALANVGEKTITALTDENERARTVNRIYTAVRQEMLRQHPWNFAMARATLAQDATAPIFQWDYAYTLPTGCLRLVTLNEIDAWDPGDWFEIEGRKILTDADSAKITYVQDVTDPNTFDALFVAAFHILLSSRIATTIRQDDAKAMQLLEAYERVYLPRARRIDGNERKKRQYDLAENSRLIGARRRGTSRLPWAWYPY